MHSYFICLLTTTNPTLDKSVVIIKNYMYNGITTPSPGKKYLQIMQTFLAREIPLLLRPSQATTSLSRSLSF